MKIEFHYTYILIAISFILTGYFSNLIIFTNIIIVHELGHYTMAKINGLNPEKIIIGGGVAGCGDLLLTPVKETLMKRAMQISAEAVQIVPAQLGNTAGVIGSSLLVES